MIGGAPTITRWQRWAVAVAAAIARDPILWLCGAGALGLGIVLLAACSATCQTRAAIVGTNEGRHAEVRCDGKLLIAGDCASSWVYHRASGRLVCADGRVLAVVQAADVTVGSP